jgi:hypothetical protein
MLASMLPIGRLDVFPPSARRVVRRIRYGAPITVVSGLPRSGTSMMMQMLEAGGMPLVTDGVRQPDEQNPRGYFELEAVKELDKGGDTSWLRGARGKAVKVISFLVTWLPETYDYRVIFMERSIDEVVESQNAMLRQRGHAPETTDADRAKIFFRDHLERTHWFLRHRRCFRTLTVRYVEAVDHPADIARQVASFLDAGLDVDQMAAVADRALYRNRRATGLD